jgi:hypothetical protein
MNGGLLDAVERLTGSGLNTRDLRDAGFDEGRDLVFCGRLR